MPDLSTNQVVSILGRGLMAQLREIVNVCDDRDAARPLYREMQRLCHELAKKHDFALAREEEPEKRLIWGKML